MTSEEGWKFMESRILPGLWRIDFARYLSQGAMDEKLIEEMDDQNSTKGVNFIRQKWLPTLLYCIFVLVICVGCFVVFIGAEVLVQEGELRLKNVFDWYDRKLAEVNLDSSEHEYAEHFLYLS